MNRRENVKKELEKAMKFRPSVDRCWGERIPYSGFRVDGTDTVIARNQINGSGGNSDGLFKTLFLQLSNYRKGSPQQYVEMNIFRYC